MPIQGRPQPQFPLESRLQIMEIKKDFRSGNFFASKGTQLKGEILRINNKVIFRWYNTDKNSIESAKKGYLGVNLTQDIPMEYFEEKAPYHFQNPFKTDGSDFGLGKVYFVIGLGVLFLIYKLTKGKK